MNVSIYLQPVRSFVPCTGVGRHINAMTLGLATRPGMHLEVFCSAQWLDESGRLPENCPLRQLPLRTTRLPENPLERAWKLFGIPSAQRWFEKADWVFAPSEVYLPRMKTRTAITLHDIQAFETDLPWSRTPEHQRFRRKWAAWVPKLMRESTVILTVSEFSKRRMVELLGADPSKIHVTGNGIDAAFLADAGTAQATAHPRPTWLVIGGLRMKKGAEAVLKVARELERQRSGVEILVVGSNEPDWAEAARGCANVRLAGKLPDEELVPALKGARGLLFLSPYEGFGIPALEAMACDVPVIAAARASLPEVVGDAGFLVEPDHAEKIVSLMSDLERDNSLRKRIVEAGRARCQVFTWDACVDRLEKILRA